MMNRAPTALTAKHCIPCEGGMPPLPDAEAQRLLIELDHDWHLVGGKLTNRFGFKNFFETIAFVNRVATIAETEGHHPDMFINYRFVTFGLITYAIGGLSENDFILAAKIQAAYDAY